MKFYKHICWNWSTFTLVTSTCIFTLDNVYLLLIRVMM